MPSGVSKMELTPLNIPNLRKIKREALKTGAWFETLNNAERSLVNLTVKHVGEIKSETLKQELRKIIRKIKEYNLENKINKKKLLNLKKKAIKRKVWFEKLSNMERSLINLTIKYVEEIKSKILYKTLKIIIEKIKKCLGPTFKEKTILKGQETAEKIAEIASYLKIKTFKKWIKGKTYITWLGTTLLNTPPSLKTI